MLGSLSRVVSDNNQGSRWIVVAVCVVGVLLAWITDEGPSLLLPTPIGGGAASAALTASSAASKKGDSSALLPRKSLAGNNANKSEGASGGATIVWVCSQLWAKFLASTVCTTFLRFCSFVYARLPARLAAFCDWAALRFAKAKMLAGLWWASRRVKGIAKSRRHFFYLMEKQILGLPIRPDETEVDSYLDCKRYLGSKWPFMWEVNAVRDESIVCAGSRCVPMSSYSYLDLLRDPSVQAAAVKAAQEWSTGNHGPRMLGGNTSILCQLERKLAAFYGRDSCLTCATGYLACMSACAAICGEQAVVFADSRLHASLRAGLKIGAGKTVLFKHNDFGDLEKLLKQQRSKFVEAWIVIESVYSMDGDIADLPMAAALAKRFDCKLMMDEAHGMGVIGRTGRGLEEHFGLQGVCTLIVGTFSKSAAGIGGYMCGPKDLIDYMDFHAPGNVFSAPLPAYCAGGVLRALELIDERPQIVTTAQKNAQRLRELLLTGNSCWPSDYPESWKYSVGGDPATTVIPLVFRDDIDRVMRIASNMKKRGFMLSAVAYPACPLREPRFRITATSAYTEDLITRFVTALVQVCVEEAPSLPC